MINNTKFFTFERYNNKDSKVSTNSRIYSLLGIVDLKERILNGTENVDNAIKMQINFDNVEAKLSEFRNLSKNFLKKALS